MILSVHQPQYIPWLGYFHKIAKSDLFVFLDNVQYKEREFQNRNKIRTPRGWMWLTVPVISKGLGRQNIREVAIDNEIDWQEKHLKSLKTCYAHAEFFKEHSIFFQGLYNRKWDKLIDLNIAIIEYILKYLQIDTPVYFETKLNIASIHTERIIDICKTLNAGTYLSGIGGKDYLEEGKFSEARLKLAYQDFKHPEYRQQFIKGKGDFIPYMSILDLIFNEGPGSREILVGGG
ncbi:hypothetical protein EPO66_03795 [bacterium]|nr:MAG: hypothetical protein EPO66_03795 [bacterium]